MGPVQDVAIGIVVHEGKVLIARRADGGHLGGYWEFPGGKMERSESPQQCVRRELLEEVGLTVRIIQRLEPIEYTYPGAHIRLHPFLCDVIGGQATARAAQEVRWVEVSELGAYRMPEANAGLVERLERGDFA